MLENIIQNNGFQIAASGITVVFLGLVLIAAVIHFFNRAFERQTKKVAVVQGDTGEVLSKPAKKIRVRGKTIPEDHLAAITVAIELYRRLHYDVLETKVTLKRGDIQTGWKLGAKFGQRFSNVR